MYFDMSWAFQCPPRYPSIPLARPARPAPPPAFLPAPGRPRPVAHQPAASSQIRLASAAARTKPALPLSLGPTTTHSRPRLLLSGCYRGRHRARGRARRSWAPCARFVCICLHARRAPPPAKLGVVPLLAFCLHFALPLCSPVVTTFCIVVI